MFEKEEVNIKDISSNNLSYTMIEFYTLIAMTCLYGAIFGTTVINQSLANMSSNGKRVSVSPTNKFTIVLASVLSSYIIALLGLAILFAYTIFVLNVDYGDNLPLIVLLGIVGSLAGLTMGVAIRKLFKSKRKYKNRNYHFSYNAWVLFIGNDGNYNEIFCR